MQVLEKIKEQLNKLPSPLILTVGRFTGVSYCSIAYGTNEILVVNIKNSKQSLLPVELMPYLVQYNIKESELFAILSNIRALLLTIELSEKKAWDDLRFAKYINNTWVNFRDMDEANKFISDYPSFKVDRE